MLNKKQLFSLALTVALIGGIGVKAASFADNLGNGNDANGGNGAGIANIASFNELNFDSHNDNSADGSDNSILDHSADGSDLSVNKDADGSDNSVNDQSYDNSDLSKKKNASNSFNDYTTQTGKLNADDYSNAQEGAVNFGNDNDYNTVDNAANNGSKILDGDVNGYDDVVANTGIATGSVIADDSDVANNYSNLLDGDGIIGDISDSIVNFDNGGYGSYGNNMVAKDVGVAINGTADYANISNNQTAIRTGDNLNVNAFGGTP